jgi:hypothetical protein
MGDTDGRIPTLHITNVRAIVTRGDDRSAPMLVFSAAIPAVDDTKRRLHMNHGFD